VGQGRGATALAGQQPRPARRNKRTAWACAWVMLALNDEVSFPAAAVLDVDAAEHFMLRAANGSMDWQTISAALRQFTP